MIHIIMREITQRYKLSFHFTPLCRSLRNFSQQMFPYTHSAHTNQSFGICWHFQETDYIVLCKWKILIRACNISFSKSLSIKCCQFKQVSIGKYPSINMLIYVYMYMIIPHQNVALKPCVQNISPFSWSLDWSVIGVVVGDRYMVIFSPAQPLLHGASPQEKVIFYA